MKVNIQNIVGNVDMEVKINLNHYCEWLDVHFEEFNLSHLAYSPETFPGMIIKRKGSRGEKKKEYNISWLVFTSGKVVIAGCKDVKELHENGQLVYEITRKYCLEIGIPMKGDTRIIDF